MKQLFGLRETNMYEMISDTARKEKSMYIHIFYDLGFCSPELVVGGQRQISAPEHEILDILEMLREEPVYRISLHEQGHVNTDCYDMLENFAPDLKKHYESIDELPKWVQDRIAVLMLLDHTQRNEEIKGIGRRINKNIFWVFKGENDGDDPRKEG
jgi:hypothetical protein